MSSSRQLRTPPRLPTYDYRRAGAYFVTICSYRRQKMLRETTLARIIAVSWQQLPVRFSTLVLDAFVIMPNHVHFLLWLSDSTSSQPSASLNDIVGAYKSLTSIEYLRWMNQTAPHRPAKIWQRGFYERVIRTDDQLNAYRRYIADNPRRMDGD